MDKSLCAEIAESSYSTGINTSLAWPHIAAINDSIDRQWVWDACTPGLAEPEHHEHSSRNGRSSALTVSVMFVLNLVIVAVARPKAPGWLCRQYGLSQLKSVPSVGYLHGRQTTLVRRGESNIRSIQYGNDYLAEGVVLTFGAHAQQPPVPMYVQSKHSGNNTLQ